MSISLAVLFAGSSCMYAVTWPTCLSKKTKKASESVIKECTKKEALVKALRSTKSFFTNKRTLITVAAVTAVATVGYIAYKKFVNENNTIENDLNIAEYQLLN